MAKQEAFEDPLNSCLQGKFGNYRRCHLDKPLRELSWWWEAEVFLLARFFQGRVQWVVPLVSSLPRVTFNNVLQTSFNSRNPSYHHQRCSWAWKQIKLLFQGISVLYLCWPLEAQFSLTIAPYTWSCLRHEVSLHPHHFFSLSLV